MPTPYYDANDGFPSFLLINDGHGNFHDVTDFSWNRLSPKQHAASQMDTQKTISFYGLGGVFPVRFLAVSDHRLLQHPHVVSGRHNFGLSPGQNQRFDLLHKSQTSHRQACRPTRLPFHFVSCDSFGQARDEILPHFFHVVRTQAPAQSVHVNQPIPPPSELQQERPVVTSVRQVKYSSVHSQSVCPWH